MCVWLQLELARTESFVLSNDDRKLKEVHLVNLNEDLLLSGVVFHFLSKSETTVGRKDAKTPPDICLNGLRSTPIIILLLVSELYISDA